MTGKVRRRHETRGQQKPRNLVRNRPAVLERRTAYPTTVRSANVNERCLKSGVNSTKLGSHIIAGEWAGSPLYSLKLEERRTCPADCQQLVRCYGDNMGRRTTRWNVDVALYARLVVELDALSYSNRWYVIRLHDLGDFASPEYVKFWTDAVAAHPGLRIFGYTHWRRGSEIGSLIEQESLNWDRFRIRFSDNHQGPRTAHVIEDQSATKQHALGHVCKADKHHPEFTCGGCAFCIDETDPVVFKLH
jgi:hypothetical protein